MEILLRIHKSIQWAYQRITRGYSDRDAWNGDMYIASVIAGIMQTIIDKGIGVPISYDNGDPDMPIEIMEKNRNEDWNKYIAIFREYSHNGPALSPEWKEEFGGVLDKDMNDAIQWLSKHFQEIWD